MPDRRFARETPSASRIVGDDARRSACTVERGRYRDARDDGEWRTAWHHLERAHILAQPDFRLHLMSHIDMLTFALSRRDGREVVGQLLRIALVPLGSLTGSLPIGNSGRARISAFIPMPLPDDLQPFFRRDPL